MTGLVLSCLLLVATHSLPAAPALRARLIGLMGRQAYIIVYSTVSLVALVLVVWRYAETGATAYVLEVGLAGKLAAIALMPVAVLLVVARLTTRARDGAPRGIDRMIRAPGSLGMLLWAGLHLAATGDAARVVLFGSFALIALIALLRRRPLLGRVDAAALRELGWWRVLLALAAYAALLHLHPMVFGVDPLGYAGWR